VSALGCARGLFFGNCPGRCLSVVFLNFPSVSARTAARRLILAFPLSLAARDCCFHVNGWWFKRASQSSSECSGRVSSSGCSVSSSHDLLPLHVTPLAKRQLSSRQTDGEVPARWNRSRLPGGRNPPLVLGQSQCPEHMPVVPGMADYFCLLANVVVAKATVFATG